MLQSVEEHSQRMVALQAKTLKMRTEKRKLKKKKKSASSDPRQSSDL